MDEQMDIFSFIQPEKTEVAEANGSKRKQPLPVRIDHEEDPGYLGMISTEYALKIKGRQLKFAELENMTGKRILFRSRCWLHGKDGTQESNRYMILKVQSYVPDREEIFDYDAPDYGIIGHADGCLVQHSAGYVPLSFWLNELYVYGGKDMEKIGYKKREFIYKIKENL